MWVSLGTVGLVIREFDPERIGSFAAGLTGSAGDQRPLRREQAGYELYLDLLEARRLLGVPIAELANRLVRLDDLFGSFAGSWPSSSGRLRDAAARHAVAKRLLARRLTEGCASSPELRRVLGRLRASHGTARIEALAAEGGWSRRHLSARFRAEVGLAPKTVARLARAEYAAGLLRAGRPLADVAYAAGYADQPHFNRDFREFVGCPPGEFPFVQDMPDAA